MKRIVTAAIAYAIIALAVYIEVSMFNMEHINMIAAVISDYCEVGVLNDNVVLVVYNDHSLMMTAGVSLLKVLIIVSMGCLIDAIVHCVSHMLTRKAAV